MAKRCEEEFNPWPAFVDIFASVILVLLLFILITVVNIGYYAQFKSKKSFVGSTEIPQDIESDIAAPIKQKHAPAMNQKKQEEDTVSFHKVEKVALEENASGSFFSGGESEGNAMSYAIEKDKKKFLDQTVQHIPPRMFVNFEDKEIFINAKVKFEILNFIRNHLERNANVTFHLEVIDPSIVISRTVSRQISLGRVLNIKNVMLKTKLKSKAIKLHLMKKQDSSMKFGQVIIEVKG